MKRMRMRAGLSMVASAVLLFTASPALAAPTQLLNKSLMVSWTTSVMQRHPDGQEKGRTFSYNRTIYISSAGRLFERTQARSSGGASGKVELAPGGGQTMGQVRGLRFAGDQLIGNVAYASGALQYVVSFSGGGCSVAVTLGKSGGKMRVKGLDGQMYDVLSATVSGQSCSIRDGNALAG